MCGSCIYRISYTGISQNKTMDEDCVTVCHKCRCMKDVPCGAQVNFVCQKRVAVHCQWSAWTMHTRGGCSRACGGGTREYTRTIVRQAKHGGSKCPGSSTKTEQCNRQPCAGEDIGAYYINYSLKYLQCLPAKNFSTLSVECMECCYRQCWTV